MATKRFKDNAWRYRIVKTKVLAKPIYLSFDDEDEGDRHVFRLEELLDKGIIPDQYSQSKAISVELIIDNYLLDNCIKPDDAALLKVIRSEYKGITTINYGLAELFVKRLKREKNLAPSTIRHYVGAIARCLDYGLAKEYIKINPFRQLPKGYAQYSDNDAKYAPVRRDIEKDRRLHDGEEEAIRAALNGDILMLFEIALETAMRLSEIYTLNDNQVDIISKTIYLDKTKNGDARQVPLSSTMVNYLKDKKMLNVPLSRKASSRYSKQFSRAVNSDFTFHCLRHEAVSRLFEKTSLSDFEIAKISGHKSMKMLSRYANLRGSNLANGLW